MTEAMQNIKRRVEDGFVLSDQGRWMHLGELRVYEKRVIEQLYNGNVLVDGKWVGIEEAKRYARAAKAAEIIAFEASQNMLETVMISMPSIPRAKPSPASLAPVKILSAINTNNNIANGVSTNTDAAVIDFSGSDDMRETAFMTIERTGSQPPVAARAHIANTALENQPQTNNAAPASVENNDTLFLGITKTAATGQSKYAMEYIEEFNYAKKRKGIANFFAAFAVILAVAAAAIVVMQSVW